MTFEELKKEFEKNGFTIDGNSFVSVVEDPHTVINGIHPKKKFEMVYICEDSIRDITDDSDSDVDEEPLYQFDILGPGREPVLTICIGNFDDFSHLV